MVFQDRKEAGQVLADHLLPYRDCSQGLVLALPRGGVPVAFEIAQALHLPLDVLVVRKLGVPGHEELALGAIAAGGVRVLNDRVVGALRLSAQTIEAVTVRETQELERRIQQYRGDRPPLALSDRILILVDDGLATGSTMQAAIEAVKREHPARIILAVPVAPQSACEAFQPIVDEVICACTPEPFYAVGSEYRNFDQTSDAEVRHLLQKASGLSASQV